MPASSISTLGAITSPRPVSRRWAITTARRDYRGISSRGSRPFGARASDLGPPHRRYGPQCRGYARSVEWTARGTTSLSDHQLFSVDEQVLSMNAEAEQQRSVAVIDVPF